MNTKVQQEFYRNGELREQTPWVQGQRHGRVRTWHKNGRLASEEVYQNGLLHGLCRQWTETGKLLGHYRMVRGTGIQREWHDNGRLKMEVSTMNGEFCGRNRVWLRDGTLISERFYLNDQMVSAEDYRAAARKSRALPKYRGKAAKLPPDNSATQEHIHRVFVMSLLEKPNRSEARDWLRKEANRALRWLGRFKDETNAGQFVEELYQAGAIEVVVPEIYGNKAGDKFSDALLVRLPETQARRKTIRAVCAQLGPRGLGAVLPEKEIGETHLFLSMA